VAKPNLLQARGITPLGLYPVTAVAEILWISPPSVRRLIRLGKLQAIRRRRSILGVTHACNDLVKSCSGDTPKETPSVERWTARRKAALVLEIIQGKTTVAEARFANGRRASVPVWKSNPPSPLRRTNAGRPTFSCHRACRCWLRMGPPNCRGFQGGCKAHDPLRH
jgi:hypothetical protein